MLPSNRTGWDSLSKSGTGCRTGLYQILTAFPVPSRRPKLDRAEKEVLKEENDVLKQIKDILE
jgi:hypothetical protein